MNWCQQNESPNRWYKHYNSNFWAKYLSVIHRNALKKRMNKSLSPVVLLHQNQPIFCLERFWAVFTCKRCLIYGSLSCFWQEYFFTRESIIMEMTFILARMNLTTDKQLFTSQDINWSTAVGLLWSFYQLFGLSFWWHTFTAEDPRVNKWCNATFLQIYSDEETNACTSWKA